MRLEVSEYNSCILYCYIKVSICHFMFWWKKKKELLKIWITYN